MGPLLGKLEGQIPGDAHQMVRAFLDDVVESLKGGGGGGGDSGGGGDGGGAEGVAGRLAAALPALKELAGAGGGD